MVFYRNTGDGYDESTLIHEKAPEIDKAALLVSEFNYLRDYDFHNFNYFSFEQDIADMTEGEFEWWYSNSFKNWLNDLDENYLDIDFENIGHKFRSQEEKRIFLLKIVNFVMFLLPYQILRLVFKNLEIDTEGELKEFLKEDINLINLRNEIMESIDHNMLQFDSFIKTLTHFEKISKKNLVEENIELLDEHVKKQNFFLEIFKTIMHETDMEKLRELMLKMLESDAKNII